MIAVLPLQRSSDTVPPQSDSVLHRLPDSVDDVVVEVDVVVVEWVVDVDDVVVCVVDVVEVEVVVVAVVVVARMLSPYSMAFMNPTGVKAINIMRRKVAAPTAAAKNAVSLSICCLLYTRMHSNS